MVHCAMPPAAPDPARFCFIFPAHCPLLGPTLSCLVVSRTCLLGMVALLVSGLLYAIMVMQRCRCVGRGVQALHSRGRQRMNHIPLGIVACWVSPSLVGSSWIGCWRNARP